MHAVYHKPEDRSFVGVKFAQRPKTRRQWKLYSDYYFMDTDALERSQNGRLRELAAREAKRRVTTAEKNSNELVAKENRASSHAQKMFVFFRGGGGTRDKPAASPISVATFAPCSAFTSEPPKRGPEGFTLPSCP